MGRHPLATSAILVLCFASNVARADSEAARKLAIEAGSRALRGERVAAIEFLERAFYEDPNPEYLELLVEQCEERSFEEDDPLPLSLAAAHLRSYLKHASDLKLIEAAKKRLADITRQIDHWDWSRTLVGGRSRGPAPVPIRFVSESQDGFFINISGQACNTPCSLLLTPGSHHLGTWGADEQNFDLVVPRMAGLVRLRPSGERYFIPGIILTVMGPVVAASLWSVSFACPNTQSGSSCFLANIIGWPLVGTTMLFSGIGMLVYRSTHMVTSVTVETMPADAVSENYLPHPRLASVGLMPIPGGASAGLGFVY